MKIRPIWAIAWALAACTQEPTPSARVAPHVQPSPEPRQESALQEFVLDVSALGDELRARALPVPEQSDADRTLAVRWRLRDGSVRAWAFADRPVLDARFIGRTQALLVLTTQHELLRLDTQNPDATPVTLDREVLGPLSLDDAGRWVVYVRGEMPEYQVMRADIEGQSQPVALAPALVPAWSPMITPDGHEVIFVASAEGSPAMFRVRDSGAAHRWMLPPNVPLPTGPSAPVMVGDAMVYESDGAVFRLGLDGSDRGTLPGYSLPIRMLDDTVFVQRRGEYSATNATVAPRALITARGAITGEPR
ncbi:MAG: hypothetical protein Q8Q09_04485 [Deltaproteobacteria bacterium]|nr:hypothetical protein [Deltaproteobacteria bacterium]